MSRLKLWRGDITQLAVDAIVNAANNSLLGGGGVDGAIHHAAGPELLEACKKLNGCATGEAKITPGFRLPARWVIHTVGPVWRGGDNDEDALLARCYQSCFDLAKHHALRSIAFPSISTGAYAFPVERAANIALAEIRQALKKNTVLEQVLVVAFNAHVHDCYVKLLQNNQQGTM